MQALQPLLVSIFDEAIESAFGSLKKAAIEADSSCEPKLTSAFKSVIVSGRQSHYQMNSSFAIFKLLKPLPGGPKQLPEVGAAIVAALPERASGVIADIQVQGGFVAFNIAPDFLLQCVRDILAAPRDKFPAPEVQRQKVVVDFSSPNIAKSMHVGHLRSTIIGDAICRILTFLGHDVQRVNHVGDWGTQFGMLLAYLFREKPELRDAERLKSAELPITDLVAFYKQAKECFDKDEDFRRQAHEEVVALQGGNELNLLAWKKLCDVSRVEFQRIYDQLDVRLEECGESFYNKMLPQVVQRALDAGIAEIDDGAAIIRVEPHNGQSVPPLIIRKSDGGYGYDATDLAALDYRLHTLNADRVIYVVDNGQGTHFTSLFCAAERMGWVHYDEKTQNYTPSRLEHVGFGLVLGEDGRKFRTRSGDTVRLQDLLDEAVTKAEQQLNERGYDESQGVPAHQVASAIGIGAVKYADLSCLRHKDYTFSFERMLNFKGNTAVYILYSYARICQVFGRAVQLGHSPDPSALRISDPSEVALLLELARATDAVVDASADLCPHHIADFIYALCTRFSDFYTRCRIVSEQPDWDKSLTGSRLAIVEAVQRAIAHGCSLLGIQLVDRM